MGGGASPEKEAGEVAAGPETSGIVSVDIDMSMFPNIRGKLLEVGRELLSVRDLLGLIVTKKLKELEESL